MISEKLYIIIWGIVLFSGIGMSVLGVLLRKRIRMEFVYMLIVGGILLDIMVLLVGSVIGIVLVE